MSEIIEAVVVCSRADDLQREMDDSLDASGFAVHEISPSVSMMLCEDPRSSTFNWERDNSLAEQMSRAFGKSLLVLYDNRVGFRFAELYESGHSVSKYDEEDEIWVLLDDKGEPIKQGQLFNISEIVNDSNNEYETLKNSIDLGLAGLTGSSEIKLSDLKSVL